MLAVYSQNRITTAIAEIVPAAPSINNMVAIPQATFALSGFNWFASCKDASLYSIQRSDGGAGAVFRFELRPGDQFSGDIDDGTTVERAEIDHIGTLDQTKVITYSFLQMIEGTGPVVPAGFCILGQMHPYPDAGDVAGGAPAISQNLTTGDLLKFETLSSDVDPLLVSPSKITRYSCRPVRGQWYRYQYRFKYSPNSNGFVQISQNNIPIVNYSGPLGYRDVLGPTPQFGIYRSASSETIVVWYSDISVGYE